MAGNSVVGTGDKSKAVEPIPPSTTTVHPKHQLPTAFTGKRGDLKGFLLKCELYFGFSAGSFKMDHDKALFAVTLLKGPAFDWVEPFTADYLEKVGPDGAIMSNMLQKTKDIFQTWKGFKGEISGVFGDLDEERTAERHLDNLKQRGSATAYTAEFQQHMGKTSWNGDALRYRYYKGLKEFIKDEIARSDKPDDLQDMIELAVKIDDRAYERALEKRGSYSNHSFKKKNRGNYWPQPMELDATFKNSGKPGRTRDPKKERQLKERLCFNCDKPGHLARECRQPKRNQGRKHQSSGRQLNATWTGRRGYNEIAVISNNEFDWDVDNEDLEEYESSSEEDLTPEGEKRLQEFTEGASKLLFKDQIPGVVAIMRKSISKTYALSSVPVPSAPRGYDQKDWVSQVCAMRCRTDYPMAEEPRGGEYTEHEATEWLRLKLNEYHERDQAITDNLEVSEEEGNNQFERRAKEQRQAMNEGSRLDGGHPSPDPEELRKLVDEINEVHDKAMDLDIELEDHNVAEIDHPWHAYIPWTGCYTSECATHYAQKDKHQNFPRNQIPIYYSWPEMEEIIRRRRSTGQLQSKN